MQREKSLWGIIYKQNNSYEGTEVRIKTKINNGETKISINYIPLYVWTWLLLSATCLSKNCLSPSLAGHSIIHSNHVTISTFLLQPSLLRLLEPFWWLERGNWNHCIFDHMTPNDPLEPFSPWTGHSLSWWLLCHLVFLTVICVWPGPLWYTCLHTSVSSWESLRRLQLNTSKIIFRISFSTPQSSSS